MSSTSELKFDPEFLPLWGIVEQVFDKPWSLPLEEAKSFYRTLTPSYPTYVPDRSEIEVSRELVTVSDGARVEAQIYSPMNAGNETLPLLFVTNGGGWVFGSHNIEETMTRMNCVKNRCRVVSVDYRMAPEFPFPYAVNDSWDVLTWARKSADKLKVNPQRIILAGSSAGANLAAVLALRARDEGVAGIIGQVLNIPATCHPDLLPNQDRIYKSLEENCDAPILNAERTRWFWGQYVPNLTSHSWHSPLLASSFEGLPPALIQVAGLDPLLDQGLAYADALKHAGVPVDLKIYPGLPHAFAALPQLSKTAEYELAIVSWVNAHLHS